jgi:hypothetical protein
MMIASLISGTLIAAFGLWFIYDGLKTIKTRPEITYVSDFLREPVNTKRVAKVVGIILTLIGIGVLAFAGIVIWAFLTG